MVEIYSNYENLNFINFNEKIISIIYKIIDKDIYEYNNSINISSRGIFLRDCIYIFTKVTKKNFFIFNLVKNEKLKELFLHIINKHMNFAININYFYYFSEIIDNFLNTKVLEHIKKHDFGKKVYFEFINCFLKHSKQILNTSTINIRSYIIIKGFLRMLFKNTLYLENILDLDTLKNIFEKIADIETNKNRKKINIISIFLIQFYIDYIAIISKKNNEKICKIIEVFEKYINELIIIIDSFEINDKNFFFHTYSFCNINKFLYNFNINTKNDIFNNPNIIEDIKNTFYKYIQKIVMSELEKIDYKVTEFPKNYIICEFLSKSPIELKKYNFKNNISIKVVKLLENIYKKAENQELSEINLIIKDKNLLEFSFIYDMININEIKTRNIILDFFKIHSIKVLKSNNNVEDFKLFIILNCYIKNLPKKLDMDENLKNIFLENLNKLVFETEVQNFLKNKDEEDFQKLFIIKLINVIKKSNLKILENLEEILNKQNFKRIMINFIDNFEKLNEYYDTDNKYSNEFHKTVFYDFMEIFFCEIGKIWYKECKKYKKIFYWRKTETRKEIYEHFAEKFTIFNSNLENEFKFILKNQVENMSNS